MVVIMLEAFTEEVAGVTKTVINAIRVDGTSTIAVVGQTSMRSGISPTTSITEETHLSSARVQWKIVNSVKRAHIVSTTVATIIGQIEAVIAIKVNTKIVGGPCLTRNSTKVDARAIKITIPKTNVASAAATIDGITISIGGTRIGKEGIGVVAEEAAMTRTEEVVETAEDTSGKTSTNGTTIEGHHLRAMATSRERRRDTDLRTCLLIQWVLTNRVVAMAVAMAATIKNSGAIKIKTPAQVSASAAI
jgi:hypothetical protein